MKNKERLQKLELALNELISIWGRSTDLTQQEEEQMRAAEEAIGLCIVTFNKK